MFARILSALCEANVQATAVRWSSKSVVPAAVVGSLTGRLTASLANYLQFTTKVTPELRCPRSWGHPAAADGVVFCERWLRRAKSASALVALSRPWRVSISPKVFEEENFDSTSRRLGAALIAPYRSTHFRPARVHFADSSGSISAPLARVFYCRYARRNDLDGISSGRAAGMRCRYANVQSRQSA